MYGSWVLVFLIFISSLPVFAVFLWFRLAKYQINLIKFLFALLAGAAAFFPALIFQDFLNFSIAGGGRIQLLYQFFIRIALTEELSRLLLLLFFFWIINLTSKSTDNNSTTEKNINDYGSAIGLIAGLGFSILENARYMALHMDISLMMLRLLTAAIHGACGSRIGTAAVSLRKNPIKALLRILTATAIHGVYNLMVTMPGLPSIIAILIAISAFATAIVTIRNDMSKTAIDKTNETS